MSTPSTNLIVSGTGAVYMQNLAVQGNSIIATNTDGSIQFVPNGNGVIGFGDVGFNNGVISTTVTDLDIVLSPDGTGVVKTGNLQLTGNTISSTDTNGDLLLVPNGSGNVGIGTTSPRKRFQVNSPVDSFYSNTSGQSVEIYGSASATPPVYSVVGSTATVMINSTDAYAQNVGASISLGGRSYAWGGSDEPHTVYTRISGVQQSGTDQYYGNFVVETLYQNTGGLREALRIDGNGNVGIGTTSPSAMLDIGGNTDGSVQAILTRGSDPDFQLQAINESSSNNSGDVVSKFGVRHGTNETALFNFIRGGAGNDGSIAIITNNSESMRVNSVGNIGIGTTTPDRDFVISKSTTTYMKAVNTTSNNYIMLGAGATSSGTILYSRQTDETTPVEFSINQGSLGNTFVLGTSGNIGIGTSSPQGKLHVEGTGSGSGTGAAWRTYLSNTTATVGRNVADPGWSINDLGIYSQKSIVTSSHIATISNNFSSDRRIKKDIVDINDSSALDTIRLIKPKKYSYIDIINRGNRPVWGFIAQEVAETLDYAVNLAERPIPNIYLQCKVLQDGFVLEITNFDTANLVYDKDGELVSKIQLITWDDKEIYAEIVTIISSSKIKIKNPLNSEYCNGILNDDNIINEIFLYGQCISDFHLLNKDAIFTVAVAALQEVDRRQTMDNERILELEGELALVKEENNLLKQQLDSILGRLSAAGL